MFFRLVEKWDQPLTLDKVAVLTNRSSGHAAYLRIPPSASLRGECGAERSCLILPSATLRGEPGTGDGCPSGDRSAPH
jgi:hypothetical protein